MIFELFIICSFDIAFAIFFLSSIAPNLTSSSRVLTNFSFTLFLVICPILKALSAIKITVFILNFLGNLPFRCFLRMTSSIWSVIFSTRKGNPRIRMEAFFFNIFDDGMSCFFFILLLPHMSKVIITNGIITVHC